MVEGINGKSRSNATFGSSWFAKGEKLVARQRQKVNEQLRNSLSKGKVSSQKDNTAGKKTVENKPADKKNTDKKAAAKQTADKKPVDKKTEQSAAKKAESKKAADKTKSPKNAPQDQTKAKKNSSEKKSFFESMMDLHNSFMQTKTKLKNNTGHELEDKLLNSSLVVRNVALSVMSKIPGSEKFLEQYSSKLDLEREKYNSKKNKLKFGQSEYEIVGASPAVAAKAEKSDKTGKAINANKKNTAPKYPAVVKLKDSNGVTIEQPVNVSLSNPEVSYIKDGTGKVVYMKFDEEGKLDILDYDRKEKIVQKEVENITKKLDKAAHPDETFEATDEALFSKTTKEIYSPEIMDKFNTNLEKKGYKPSASMSGSKINKDCTPIEILLLDEMSRGEARSCIKNLAEAGAYGTAEQTAKEVARNTVREVEYEISGITDTADLKDAMNLCSNPQTRMETEKLLKEKHSSLEQNDGSYMRAYIASDGWNDREVDQFDATWIQNGAYAPGQVIYQRDEHDNILKDDNGQPIAENVLMNDQEHRSAVINRLCFGYGNKEELLQQVRDGKITVYKYNSLMEDAKEARQAAFKAMDTTQAGGTESLDFLYFKKVCELKNEELGIKPQFVGQSPEQAWLSNNYLDNDGKVDVEAVSADNTLLFKGEKPPVVQAEETLYSLRNGDFSTTFDATNPDVYTVMSAMLKNGEVKGINNLQECYKNAYESAEGVDEKLTIKANAIISDQLRENFSDKDVADTLIALMRRSDENAGFGGSTGFSGSFSNTSNLQDYQIKTILQTRPEVLAKVREEVENGEFGYNTYMKTSSYSSADSTHHDTKQKYLDMIDKTDLVSKEPVFLDASGQKITDAKEIEKKIAENMKSIQSFIDYSVELEREFKMDKDAEGCFSRLANTFATHSGLGTDSDDVVTQYAEVKAMRKR